MSEAECEVPPSKRLRLDETVSEHSKDDYMEGSKYDNYVTPEELQKLKEFQVLDEVKSNDEDSNDEESDSSDGKSEGLPEEEIEKMLDEDLPDGFKGAPKQKEKPFITRQKIVLEEKGVNHFEVLPLDWMMVRHYSGMPVYMHRATRVCTLSKPYFLGKGNTRRHDIPISAIPCFAYRRALEEEAKQKEIDRKIEEQIKNGTWATNGKAAGKKADEKRAGELKNKLSNEGTQSNDVGKTSGTKPEASGASMQCPYKSSFNEISVNGNDEDHIGPNNVDVTNSTEDVAHIEVNNVISNNPEVGSSNIEPSNEISNRDVENVATERSNATSNTNDIEMVEIGSCENVETTNNEIEGGASVDIDDVSNRGENGVCEDGEAGPDVEVPANRQPVVLPGGIVMPPPRVETVNTSWKTQHLTHEQVNGYCRKLFRFKTVNIMHFKRWADRRKYTKARKTLQYPTLPEGTKLITIPAQPSAGAENGGKSNKRDWVMNMNGRSYLSVFHEYVRRALQKQPVYEFVQLENASTPYQATVYIGGMQYGVGHGSSKRQAKSAAARASIHILIPEMKDELDAAAPHDAPPAGGEPDFSFFDYVSIEDPRITEFCAATCEPSPHAILRTCLLRNFGAGDRHIQTEMKKLEFQKIELTMKVGKHTATVVCKNKKTAKQRASQAILQALHPHVRSWGSLLRLYGSRSVKSCKEKKLEEQQITLLQDKARRNEPNHAVLAKLRHEMRRLRERDAAVVPIGTLLLRADLPTHSGANLGNVDL